MIAFVAGTLLLVGATLALLAAIGVLRMPDVFTRMQSSTKASTLGLACLLVGLIVLHPNAEFIIRAGSIAAFVMLTTPVSAHVIARSAAQTDAPLWEGTIVDERPPRPSDHPPASSTGADSENDDPATAAGNEPRSPTN